MLKKKQTLSKGSTCTLRLAPEKCITARNSFSREKTGTSLSGSFSLVQRMDDVPE
jgi:hypothetical protein